MKLSLRPSCRIAATQKAVRGRTAFVVKAQLDSTNIYAITQQAIAFIVVSGAESAWSISNRQGGEKGGVQVPVVAASLGAVGVGALLLNVSSATQVIGDAAGLLASGLLMSYYLQRTINTPDSQYDFPGPKSVPGTMVLFSFFLLAAFFQTARGILG